jgi:hypothetical protein
MNRLSHKLASIAQDLLASGFEKEANNVFLTAIKMAHKDNPLAEVVEELGFEDAEGMPNEGHVEIFVHVHPEGGMAYEIKKGDEFQEFPSFEEVVSHLAAEDEEDCGCGCGGNCKTAATKKKKNQGKKLNKPFRTPGGPKKFSVYVKNENGNVVKVNFGDPNMKIRRSEPGRRKNFRARHNCENPGPKTKARYWSCRMWSKPSVSKILKGNK